MQRAANIEGQWLSREHGKSYRSAAAIFTGAKLCVSAVLAFVRYLSVCMYVRPSVTRQYCV